MKKFFQCWQAENRPDYPYSRYFSAAKPPVIRRLNE